MRRTTVAMITAAFVAAFFVVPGWAAPPDDRSHHRQRHRLYDEVYFSSGTAITGTWSCADGSTTCTEDTTSGNAVAELSANDIVDIGGYSYVVESVTDDDNFERLETLPVTGTVDDLVAQTSKTVYIINTGATPDTATTFCDGSGECDDVVARIRDDAADAESLPLRVSNFDEPADTETGQAAGIAFSLMGTTDGGSTFSESVAAKIVAVKRDDYFNGSGLTEHDARVKFYVADDGVLGEAFYITPGRLDIRTTAGINNTWFTIGTAGTANFNFTDSSTPSGATLGMGYNSALVMSSDGAIHFTSTTATPSDATSSDLDLTRSAASTLCVSNGDESGCDGVVDVDKLTTNAGSNTATVPALTGTLALLGVNQTAASFFRLNGYIRSDIYMVAPYHVGSSSFEPDYAANDTQLGEDGLMWEGSTVDAYETILTADDPTADQTVTVPDKTGTVALMDYVKDTAPTEPFACGATTIGQMVYVDDTNDNSFADVCICAYDDNPGTYDWRDLGDISGTACPYF